MDGPSVYKWWHAMWAQVCNLLFPRGCAGCDAPDEVLCAACWALFAQCRERDADSGGGARIWSASIYQGAVRRAILDAEQDANTIIMLGSSRIGGSGAIIAGVNAPKRTCPYGTVGQIGGRGIAWVRRRCATMQCPELLHQGTLRAAGLFGTACPSYYRSCQGEA